MVGDTRIELVTYGL